MSDQTYVHLFSFQATKRLGRPCAKQRYDTIDGKISGAHPLYYGRRHLEVLMIGDRGSRVLPDSVP